MLRAYWCASVRDGVSRAEISYEALSPQHPAISQKCQAISVQVGRMAHRELAAWIIGAVPKSAGRESGRCPRNGPTGTISRVTNLRYSPIIRISWTESGIGWETGY